MDASGSGAKTEGAAMTRGTFAALFAGGGLADIGAMQAGLEPLWTIELDPDAAACHTRNLPGRMIVADVRTVDLTSLPTPTVLWASPPCPDFSVARSKKLPVDAIRADLGLEALRFARALLPPVIIVENVIGYADSAPFRAIVAGLAALGYTVTWDTVDASDYGVPQTRRRLFLRAIRGGLLLPLPAPMRPKIGWYTALEDLLPGLPDSHFADWQLRRLPDRFRGDLLVKSQNASAQGPVFHCADDSAFTVTTVVRHAPRAFLVRNQISQSQDAPIVREGDAPGPIVTTNSSGRLRAFLAHPSADNPRFVASGEDDPCFTVTCTNGAWRAWLDGGRVVKLSPRCLARLMGVPDWYVLPERASVAGRVLGNGVCPPVSKMLCENVLLALGALAA